MIEGSTTAPIAEPVWHALSTDEVLTAQQVDANAGLAPSEADSRRARQGANQLTATAVEPSWRAFLRQYQDPMQILLLVAAVASLFIPMGHGAPPWSC